MEMIQCSDVENTIRKYTRIGTEYLEQENIKEGIE